MSRKGLVIIITFVVILLSLLGGLYYYLKVKQSAPGETSAGFTLRDLFPFGQATQPVTPTVNNPDNTSTQNNTNNNNNPDQQGGVSNTNPPVLRHISESPIAGATIFDRIIISTSTVASTTGGKAKVVVKREVHTAIRFMNRATGNIYETSTSSLETSRVSNTTFPKVYEAYFDASGENLIARTILNEELETISTYFGHLKKETPTSTESILETTLISDSVDAVATSPARDRIFSLGSTGGEKGVVSAFDGSKKNLIWTSLLKEWLVSWPSEDSVLLTTKPTATVSGVAYLLNLSTKATKKIGSSLPGLTVSLSPNLNYLLYAQSDTKSKSFQFGLMDKNGKAPTPLFVKTLPEKCTWSKKNTAVVFCAVPDTIPAATYPDDWYMGKVSFSDSIWSLNVVTGEARDIAPIRELIRGDIDAINLSLDSREDYLLFTNKKDLSLWGLQISPVASSTASTTI